MAKLKENSTILKHTGEEIIATEESVDRKLLLKADKDDLDAHKADYTQHPYYAGNTSSKGTGILVITLPVTYPNWSAVPIGACFSFKNIYNNQTIASGVKLALAGLSGEKPILKSNGSLFTTLTKDAIYTVRWNGVNFILQGEGGEYGTAQPEHVLVGYTIGTEEGIKSGTMPNHGSKTFTPSDTVQTSGAGYYSGVTVNPRPTLSGNATPDQVLAGRTFYSNSYTKRTGTLVMPISYSSLWTQRTSGFGSSTYIYGVAYGNNMFVAVGQSGKLATSTDGITWIQRTSGFGSTTIYDVVYGNNMFVAVGADGKLATSTDGITWTQRTSGFGITSIRGVAYGNNMFVAVGQSGKLATSTDGITWTQRTSSFVTTIRDVAYGNNMFVAVGDDGKLATSSDGITWTQRTSSFGTSYIYGVAYGEVYGNSMFVVVGDYGKLATSTNGTTWTLRTSSFGDDTIYGVAYGDNMFVAVGRNAKLATLVDGTTWIQRNSSFDYDNAFGDDIYGVAYGVVNGNSMFVVVGKYGKLATLS